jgi:hypothetical protein
MTTTATRTFRTAAGIAALTLSAALIIAIVAVNAIRNSSGADPATQASRIQIGSAATATPLSPAAALAADRPIVLFFYPFEACQIRYCLQPNQVAAQLGEAFEGAVSFVPVITHAIPTDPTGLEAAVPRENITLPMENWDLWLLPPYDAWIPEMQETDVGLGLTRPTLVLVDSDRQVLERSYTTHEVMAAIHELIE